MERAIDSTAKALANLGQHVTSSGKDQGLTKNFQMLIKMIGEAKTKHVSIMFAGSFYYFGVWCGIQWSMGPLTYIETLL